MTEVDDGVYRLVIHDLFARVPEFFRVWRATGGDYTQEMEMPLPHLLFSVFADFAVAAVSYADPRRPSLIPRVFQLAEDLASSRHPGTRNVIQISFLEYIATEIAPMPEMVLPFLGRATRRLYDAERDYLRTGNSALLG